MDSFQAENVSATQDDPATEAVKEATVTRMMTDFSTEITLPKLGDLISDEVIEDIMQFADLVVFPVVGLTGIIGSILSMIILCLQVKFMMTPAEL